MPEPRRTFVPVLLPGVLATALAAVASAKVWASVASAPLVDHTAARTAGEVPLASALSLVCLAAWGALLVTRSRARRITAALGLVAAVALDVVAVRAGWTVPDAVRRAAGGADASLTGWYWTAVVMLAVVTATFALSVRYAAAWPGMSSRYDRATGESAEPAEPTTNHEIWKAIDEGHDPTV